MALKDPQEILKEFYIVWDRLRTAEEAMDPHVLHKIANDLSEVYNYVSECASKPSMVNSIRSRSASDERLRKLHDADQQNLSEHRQFVETHFDSSEKYFKTIQLVGYTVFFTILGITKENIDPSIFIYSVILLAYSASIFVLWEIWKATVLSIMMRRHAQIGLSSLERFVVERSKIFQHRDSAMRSFTSMRVLVWFASTVTAVISVSILIYSLITQLIQQ